MRSPIYQIRFRSLGPAGGCADRWRRWRCRVGLCGLCNVWLGLPVVDLIHHQRRCCAPSLALPRLALPHPRSGQGRSQHPQRITAARAFSKAIEHSGSPFLVSEYCALWARKFSGQVANTDELRIKRTAVPHAPVTLTPNLRPTTHGVLHHSVHSRTASSRTWQHKKQAQQRPAIFLILAPPLLH